LAETSEKNRKPNSPLATKTEWQDIEENIRKYISSSADGTNQFGEAINSKLDVINATLKCQSEQIEVLSDENSNLRARCNLTEGQVTGLEKVVEDLRDELL